MLLIWRSRMPLGMTRERPQLRGASAASVERPSPRTGHRQHKQPAGNSQVLLEVEELAAVAELVVEEHGRRNAEHRKRERRKPRAPADGQHQPADQLQGDYRWQQ